MNFIEAEQRLSQSPVIRLIKGDNAALCLGFLHSVFRQQRAITRTQDEMISRLTTALDDINGDIEPKRFTGAPKYYLDQWVSAGALQTQHDDSFQVCYEITPEADQALLIFEGLGRRPEVSLGAESKLRAITNTLQEIAERANPDRHARIASLEEQVTKIQDEITRLRSGVELKADTPEMLLERYLFAVDISRQLLADFSAIRQRFLMLARELSERYAMSDVTRGDLLSRVIQAHNELNEGPQGQSFRAFRDFLLSPEAQKVMFQLLENISKIPVIGEEENRSRALARLPRNLMAEAKSVIETTRRLSSELRRMLDTKAIATRRATHEALSEIRSLAFGLADSPPEEALHESDEIWPDITGAEMNMRLLWKAPEVVPPMGESKPIESGDKSAFLDVFGGLSSIEIERLEKQLRSRFDAGDNAFRLTEMLEWFPPVRGNWLLDVIGYLEIARSTGSNHIINSTKDHSWRYTVSDTQQSFILPQIYFYRSYAHPATQH